MPRKPKSERKSFFEGSFFQTIKEVAPDIAGGILSTAGNLTGIELLTKAGELIDKDPELTQEDKINLLEKLQHEKEIYALEVQDRDSARKREIAFTQSGKRDWFMYVVGSVGLIVLIIMIYALIWRDIPERNHDLFVHGLGIIEGVAVSIFAYYFGSSKGSKDKTEMLTKRPEE